MLSFCENAIIHKGFAWILDKGCYNVILRKNVRKFDIVQGFKIYMRLRLKAWIIDRMFFNVSYFRTKDIARCVFLVLLHERSYPTYDQLCPQLKLTNRCVTVLPFGMKADGTIIHLMQDQTYMWPKSQSNNNISKGASSDIVGAICLFRCDLRFKLCYISDVRICECYMKKAVLDE